MIKVIPIQEADGLMPSRDEVFDEEGQRVLGNVGTFKGKAWAASALVPVSEQHPGGRAYAAGCRSREEAVEAVVMMHRYWTLPAFEKEES